MIPTNSYIREWVTYIERQTGPKVKISGLDVGTEFGQSVVEFQVDKLSSWVNPKGITLFKTTPRSPWMGGRVETLERAAGYSAVTTVRLKVLLSNPKSGTRQRSSSHGKWDV